MEKIFVHYLDKNKEGKDIDVSGYFVLVREGKHFLEIKTERNIIKIPYQRIIKLKGGKK